VLKDVGTQKEDILDVFSLAPLSARLLTLGLVVGAGRPCQSRDPYSQGAAAHRVNEFFGGKINPDEAAAFRVVSTQPIPVPLTSVMLIGIGIGIGPLTLAELVPPNCLPGLQVADVLHRRGLPAHFAHPGVRG